MAKPTRYTPELIAAYSAKGCWEQLGLSEFWDRNAKDYPQKEAIADSKTTLTWGEAKQWTDRIALGFLEQGIKRDELVVVQLVNSVELCLTRVACEKAGVLCLPVLRTISERNMEYLLEQTGAVAMVIHDQFRDYNYLEMIESIRPRVPGLRKVFVVGKKIPQWAISLSRITQQPIKDKYAKDCLSEARYKPTEVSLINSTTGTTGLPKFAEYTMCARLTFGNGIIEALRLTGDDVIAALSPAPTGPNIPVYFAAPLVAAKVVFLERFTAEDALKLLQKERTTIACGVPAQLALLLQHPDLERYDLSSVRAFWCTGAELPYQVGKEFEVRTGVKVVNMYGGVDFGGIVATGVNDPLDVRLLTVGKPRGRTEIKLVDEAGQEVPNGEVGEAWGRGPACSSGYYNDPESTWQSWTRDGWFKTGDLCKFDEQGNLVIVGRKKDIIIRGGWNIYPKEIENILITHPKVRDVAIIGMHDPIMGEKICAFIIPESNQEPTLTEIVSFLQEKDIPPYKLPERLEILDKLPMVADGQKVDKKLLRQDIDAKLKAEGIITRSLSGTNQ
ncbi:MAG: AMP-binding protein [Chloroflexi bacterium]|nr:AMP-binding protein [Chloroflexota bacterium]